MALQGGHDRKQGCLVMPRQVACGGDAAPSPAMTRKAFCDDIFFAGRTEDAPDRIVA
jgi:hypothetical protein